MAHIKFIFIVFLSLTIFSCGSKPEPPLRIGSNSWPGYEPLYIARDEGYYDNTSVKLVALSSASDVISALRTNNLEGAALTLDESLTLLEDGIKVKIILIMDFSHGGDVLLAKPYINTLEDLKDKIIAVETTAVGAILLDGALDSAGLNVSDITIKNCSVDKHLECYDTVDAIVTFDPADSQLRNKGAKLIFDSSQIPGRIVDVLVVKESVIKAHAASVSQLIKGYFKARELLEKDPMKAAKSMAPRLNLSAEAVLASFNGIKLPSLAENHQLLDEQNSTLIPTIQKLSTIMHKKGLLRREISDPHMTSSQFLPK